MAIVVSHIAETFEGLCSQARRQMALADVVELRLDRCGNPGREALKAELAGFAKPVIVTAHGPEAGGSFAGGPEAQLELLRDAAEAGANFVDVDWTLSLDLGEVAGKCHRIVSRHDFDSTPSDLPAFLEDVEAVLYEGDLVKLIPHAQNTEDGLRTLAFLRSVGGGKIIFASGPAGSFTRLLAPIFGSPFTYAAAEALPGEPEPESTGLGQLRVGELRAAMPPGGLTPETAILGVVGRPVSGSWSPWVQGMALKAAKLDAVYVALEPETLEGLLELTRDENYRGFSITAPFKAEAFALGVNPDGSASEARVANTLVRERDHWRCMNTDVPAVRDALEKSLGIHARRTGAQVDGLGSARVLVLGAGGAARAAVRAVLGAGGQVIVAGRRSEAAAELAADLAVEAIEWDAIAACEYDVLVNATPVGSVADPDESPIPADWIRPGTLVLDAVYRPIRTPLLMAAGERGCTPVPGAEWFVRQAAAQFRLFTHNTPDESLMRAAFEHAHEMAGGG